MSRVSTFFKALGAIIRDPRLMSAALHDQRYWKSKFNKRFGHNNALPRVPYAAFVPDTTTLDGYDFGGDTSMITDMLLLKHLAMRSDVSSYLEIGTWRGATAATVAPFVDRVVTIDLEKAKPEEVDEIGKYIREVDNVVQIRANTMNLDFSTLDGPFDLIFIDGDHRAEYVTSDTRNVLAHLCHDRTIVLWHDYGVDPENVRWEVYYGILDGVDEGRWKQLSHISNTKIAALLYDGVISSNEDNPSEPLWRIDIHKPSSR